MVLGDKSALTQELRDVYAVTGASHVLALSGLHLSIIFMLLTLLLGGSRSFTLHSSLFTILSVWAFVFLVGMSTSVVRSATMLTVYALLSLGHRDKMSVNTLAFTAIVMLAVSPLSLYDVGFQIRALLLLFPADELNRHPSSHTDIVAVACGACVSSPRVPFIIYSEVPQYRLGANGCLARSEY